MRLLFTILLVLSMDVVPSGEAFLRQLQKRDSVLIADQLEYGVELQGVREGTALAFPDFSPISGDTLQLVRGWQIDTLKLSRRQKTADLKASVVIAPFEAGTYHLPPVMVRREFSGEADTLVFDAPELEVTTIAIDPENYEIHDIKGQIRYPLTFRELFPYLLAFRILLLIAVVVVSLVRRSRRAGAQEAARKDPPHIVALRKLDTYKGDKYWAPARQKAFYSGVTDAVKEYIDARFGIDAPEMTTAELFDSLKASAEVDKDLRDSLNELFVRADFVKFAKYTASDEENAAVLPTAVRFVTSTYQAELEDKQS